MLHVILFLLLEISELELVVVFGAIIFLILTIFFASFLISSYKRKIRFRQQLVKLDFEKQQELLQTQLEIQEQTFKNISQEIHDNIGQVLSLAKLTLNSFPKINDPAVQTKVDNTKQLVSKALRDLRDLSRSMHGDKIAEIGLKAAIAAELKLLQNTGKFTTDLHINGSEYPQGKQTEMVLFRTVQEALNNAVKHSKASTIQVQIDYEPATFKLTVMDDGIGFDPAMLNAVDTGIGLKNMQNRAALIGALFTLNSGDQKGTSVMISLNTQHAT